MFERTYGAECAFRGAGEAGLFFDLVPGQDEAGELIFDGSGITSAQGGQ
jgi:hypothetical protein